MEQRPAALAVEQQPTPQQEECKEIERTPLNEDEAAQVYTKIFENKARFMVRRTVQGAPPRAPFNNAPLRVCSCLVACVRRWPWTT